MSVKLIDNEAFYGFRVRRTVNGKLYQEYFSLKKDGKRVNARTLKLVQQTAQERDDVLAAEQEKWKQKMKAENCFHDDGSIKGISYLLKKEKSSNMTPIFQVGIASELEKKIICTSYSINAHGVDGAWKKAVETFAEHKNIAKGTKLFKSLLAAMPKVDMSVVKPTPVKAKVVTTKVVSKTGLAKASATKAGKVVKAAKPAKAGVGGKTATATIGVKGVKTKVPTSSSGAATKKVVKKVTGKSAAPVTKAPVKKADAKSATAKVSKAASAKVTPAKVSKATSAKVAPAKVSKTAPAKAAKSASTKTVKVAKAAKPVSKTGAKAASKSAKPKAAKK